MPTYSLKRFSRPEILQSIHPHCLLQLLLPFKGFFSNRGMQLPELTSNPQLDHRRLVSILVTPDVDTPKDLADALYYIHEMSTPEGMDALLDAVSLETLHCSVLELEPADIAVRVWLHDRQVLERTHAEIFATKPRRFQYFQSYLRPTPPFTAPTPAELRPLEAALDDLFEKKNRGRGVRVFAFPHVNECLFLVRHGDPYRREGALNGDEESSVLYRPLKFNVVIYDYQTGTLRIHASRKWETSMYRGLFGKHLFGCMDYFPDIGRYTLEPLRTQGQPALECADVPQLKYVVLTEVYLHWGGPYNEIEVRKAKNIFAALRRRSGKLSERPKLVRASFDIHFRGSKQPRPLMLKPPNIAQYSRDDDCTVIDRWLSLRGFIRHSVPEAREDADALLASA